MLPLLEIVGVTSTEKTYFVGFVFLESEKKGQCYLGFKSVSDNVEGQRKHVEVCQIGVNYVCSCL